MFFMFREQKAGAAAPGVYLSGWKRRCIWYVKP